MRRRALLLALLGTTCLTPREAEAGPVSAFIAGFAASFGASATTGAVAGALGGAASAGFAVGAFIAGPLGSIIIGLGLAALQPQPEVPKPSSRMANFAQPISYQERVYGRVRKGGPLGFTAFHSGTRFYVPLIAAHSTRGPFEHWLDERKVEVQSENVTTDPPGGLVKIRTMTGQPGQEVRAALLNTFSEITEAHDFAGLSYAVVSAERPDPEDFAEIYPSDTPAYTPVWEGNDRIYDPRDGKYKFTRNWALCVAHELTEYQGREVDWNDVAVEADVCDEAVSIGSGTIPRWRLDGIIADDQEWEDIRTQMMGAADGFIYERPDGKVGFHAGRWIEPTVTLTERDFLSLEISEGEEMGAATEFVVQYVEPENDYREAPTGAWVHDPSAKRVREEIATYMVSSHNQAARIAKRLARTKRARYTINGTLSLSGYELIGQRFAMFQHAELGMSFPIEIGKLTWNSDRITFGLEAVSTAEEDFAFVAANEEPQRPSYDKVQSSDVVPDAIGLEAEAVQSTGGSAAIEWSWPSQPTGYRQQLRFRRMAEAEWQYVSAERDQTTVTTTGLIDGATYEGQLRNRTGSGRNSAWKPDAAVVIQAIANQTPPGALTEFQAVGGVGEATVSFHAPNDAQYYATRIYRALDSFNSEDAVLVRTEYGIPSNSDSWTDDGNGEEGLPPGSYSYWGDPINASGVAGLRVGPSTATVT